MQGNCNLTYSTANDDGIGDPENVTESKIQFTPIADSASKARKLTQLFAASAAMLDCFVTGSAIGWSSSVQTQLQRNITEKDDPSSVWLMLASADQMSWISSLLNIGALIGSLFGGFMIDWVGRRRTVITPIPLFIASWILITLAVDTSMLYVGRIVSGIAAGICSASVPSYLAEISTPETRGINGMLFTAFLGVGVLLSSALAWLPWRWISGILALSSVICLPIAYFIPESPYYLVKRGQSEDARKTLKWLRDLDSDIESELVYLENRVQLDAKTIASFSDIFRPWAFKPVLIGMALMILQQFCGFTVVLYYSVEIFSLAGSDLDPRIGSIIVKAVLVISQIFSSTFLIQKLKRRTIFIFTELVTALSIFVMGSYYYMQESGNATNLGWLPIVSLIIFISASGSGISALCWLISNEVLPAKFRGPGSTIVTFTYWIMAFVSTKTFTNLKDALTLVAPFWFYGCCTVLGVLFGVFLLPETKNKTPEQIQSLF